MAELEPKRDFRWRNNAEHEVEAFQVTKGARWANQDWPNWLNTLRGGKGVGGVYTDAAAPDSLFIALESGDFQIAENAYVVFDGGELSVSGDIEFEREFIKVVPLPEKVVNPESLPGFERNHKMVDGKLVALTPEEREALPPIEEAAVVVSLVRPVEAAPAVESNLRPKAEIAFELLLTGEIEAAMVTLKSALSDEVRWCDCSPGSCANGARWSCRQKSPLVQ